MFLEPSTLIHHCELTIDLEILIAVENGFFEIIPLGE